MIPPYRVQQLEEENAEMKVNVCRLKSQTEKLDQVRDASKLKLKLPSPSQPHDPHQLIKLRVT